MSQKDRLAVFEAVCVPSNHGGWSGLFTFAILLPYMAGAAADWSN